MKTLEDIQLAANMGELFGLYEGIPNEVYHHKDSPGVSSSFLKKILSSTPMHAKASLEEQEDTESLIVGRAFHTIMESDELFKQQYTYAPEGMKRDARSKGYQEFLAQNPGKTVLTLGHFEMIQRMRDAIVKHRLFPMTQNGRSEVSGYWTDEQTGELCKIRPDVLTDDGLIFDWKTSMNPVNPYSFSKVVHEHGYHLSAAMYLEGLSKILRTNLQHYVLVAVEKKKPHGVIFYDVDASALEKGMEEFRHALTVYAHCKKTNEWPGYSSEFEMIGLPAYAYSLTSGGFV